MPCNAAHKGGTKRRLPNKAYEAEFASGFSEISYFPRKNSTEESLVIVPLPNWLTKLIQAELFFAKKEAREETQSKIREALGMKN